MGFKLKRVVCGWGQGANWKGGWVLLGRWLRNPVRDQCLLGHSAVSGVRKMSKFAGIHYVEICRGQ